MKRLPLIRHIRWLYLSWRVEQHYARWAKLGMLPSYRDHDEDMLNRVWLGQD